jgi:hypothetical protein
MGYWGVIRVVRGKLYAGAVTRVYRTPGVRKQVPSSPHPGIPRSYKGTSPFSPFIVVHFTSSSPRGRALGLRSLLRRRRRFCSLLASRRSRRASRTARRANDNARRLARLDGTGTHVRQGAEDFLKEPLCDRNWRRHWWMASAGSRRMILSALSERIPGGGSTILA